MYPWSMVLLTCSIREPLVGGKREELFCSHAINPLCFATCPFRGKKTFWKFFWDDELPVSTSLIDEILSHRKDIDLNCKLLQEFEQYLLKVYRSKETTTDQARKDIFGRCQNGKAGHLNRWDKRESMQVHLTNIDKIE